MGQFNVYGADRNTGEDKAWIVEASSAESAGAKAAKRGLMVSSVEPVESDPLADLATSSVTPAAVGYSSRTTPRRSAAGYPVLMGASYGLLGCAGLLLLGFAWAVFRLLQAMASASPAPTVNAGPMDPFAQAAAEAALWTFGMMSVSLLAGALFFATVGGIGLAVRDIARRG
ncbi:MAG: hypothetical protein AAGD32_06135 [Planctomycetota bacterium]